MTELKQKILAKIQQPTLSTLATVTEHGKPWVRYVTLMADENLTIWGATFCGSRKVPQIKNNPEVHVTTGVSSMETAECYLQIQGTAEILSDPEVKKTVLYDHLQHIFSGPDDPNYCVLKISPYRIEFQGMGPVPPEVWEP